MRVIPVRARLLPDIEVVEERVIRRDGALVDEGGTVGPVGSSLEETMPVLSYCLYQWGFSRAMDVVYN